MAYNINDILSKLSSEQLKSLQAAILSGSLKDNHFLPNNLQTRTKDIISTINDMSENVKSNKFSNIRNLEHIHTIIGNPEGTEEERNMYTHLMGNVIKGDTRNLTAGKTKECQLNSRIAGRAI